MQAVPAVGKEKTSSSESLLPEATWLLWTVSGGTEEQLTEMVLRLCLSSMVPMTLPQHTTSVVATTRPSYSLLQCLPLTIVGAKPIFIGVVGWSHLDG